MRPKKGIKNLIMAIAMAVSLLAVGLASASDGVEQTWQVLGGGSTDATAEGVTLRATLGQPVVGAVSSSDGSITVGQGLWHGGAPTQYKNYLPLVLRSGP